MRLTEYIDYLRNGVINEWRYTHYSIPRVQKEMSFVDSFLEEKRTIKQFDIQFNKAVKRVSNKQISPCESATINIKQGC